MSYVRVGYPYFRAFNDDNTPGIGHQLESYEAGNSTPIDTYQDRELTIPNTNPIICDPLGVAIIYVGVAIKLVHKDADGVLIDTYDWLGEQQESYIKGITTPGTTNNNYVVEYTPALTALTNEIMLVMTPDVDNQDTLVSQTFTGTGIDDAVFSGPYVGSTAGSVFTAEIDANGTPDTFRWKKDGGAWTSGVAITAALQVLLEGIGITYAETTGHTIGDIRTVEVMTPVRINLCSLGNKIGYKNIGQALKALSGRDLIDGIPATWIYSSAQDCYILLNPSDPVLESVIPSRIRKELTTAYQVVLADRGTELSCVGPITVTMPDAPDVPNSFFYIYRVSGAVTIDFGTYDAYMPLSTTAINSFILEPGTYGAVQLVTNGVDWHILTTTLPPFNVIQVITSDDASWDVPQGITIINVTVIGGGGGGGGCQSAAGAGYAAGGGGGSLTQRFVDLTGVSTVNIDIGAGGAGGIGNQNGSAGATTTFGAYLSAAGGGGGEKWSDGDTPGSGGTNTLYANQTDAITFDGYPGIAGGASTGAGGNSALRRGQGGAARGATTGNGNPGGNYGAGGSGAYTSGPGTGNGGAGAPGLCVIRY